jgi:hypothetical protein
MEQAVSAGLSYGLEGYGPWLCSGNRNRRSPSAVVRPHAATDVADYRIDKATMDRAGLIAASRADIGAGLPTILVTS